MSRIYKHCVVGQGLTGTAACKHLASLGEDVILVGPSEGSGAHGACYDEGRIYRILDPIQSWALLAERSIDNYPSIAALSKINFYEESGLLIFGVDGAFIKQTKEVAAKMKTSLDELDPKQLHDKFNWLIVPPTTKLGLLQTKAAGHLSPRKLCKAQLEIAKHFGAMYLDASVEAVHKDSGSFFITLSNNEGIRAENVLIAAGVYSSVMPLLPQKVEVSLTGHECLLAEVSADTVTRLSNMPSMIYVTDSEDDDLYLLPPIMYPDGSWLLKVGPLHAFAPPLKTKTDVDNWYKRSSLNPAFEAKAITFLKDTFADLEILSFRPLFCVTDGTPTKNAFIDCWGSGSSRWGVCTGGNGWAAKSSDEIGHLAAQMMTLPDRWTPDLSFPQDWFRTVTSTQPSQERTSTQPSQELTQVTSTQPSQELTHSRM